MPTQTAPSIRLHTFDINSDRFLCYLSYLDDSKYTSDVRAIQTEDYRVLEVEEEGGRIHARA